MGLSLRELKDYLIEKGGYTITPSHNQLTDLKILVDDMMNVRSENPPSTGSGSYSGTNCIGHTIQSGYKLSLGDINALDIKGCSCHTVNDTTAYCRSRTYSCSCNSNAPTCTCNGRTVITCDCRVRTAICSCNQRNAMEGTCPNVIVNDTIWEEVWCSCDTRTSSPCNCQGRTSSCGSRSTTSCTCNGRCACNAEKRFS